MSKRRLLRNRSRAEELGAVAIMVGLLATLLFSVAAMSVDLGNAWARARAVQKQVDVSAIGAGWLLPMDSTKDGHHADQIADKVADYLNDPENQAAGQSHVSGADLLDGSSANGEIYWLNQDGSTCTDDCTTMRVAAPRAHVDFGLANAIGFSGTNVQRSATVQVQSGLPKPQQMMPFWLASGCGYGPTEADTTQGNSPTATPTATATATATATPSAAPVTPSPVDSSFSLTGAAVTSVGFGGSTKVSGYAVSGVQGYQKITLRAFSPSGSTYVDYGVELPSKSNVVPDFQVSTEISNTAGDWTVYIYAEKNNSTAYSASHLIIRVTGGSPSPTATPSPTSTPSATESAAPAGCMGQDRGNFGQLDSPRTGYNSQQGFPYNIALGLDHQLAQYLFPPATAETKDCGKNTPTIPGGKFDDTAGPAGDGANCIIGDTGNDGPKTYDGLIAGPDGSTPGRLNAVANGATTCPGRSNLSIGGKPINNDVLSCFLRNGATLGDIAQTSGVTQSMLDPSVMNSPRFVYLPVVYATDRAQKDFQPILTFVPGFITDETQASTQSTSDATSANGLELNGNSVKVLHVYTFNRSALPPPDEDSDTTDYDPDIGGGMVRLIQ